MLNKNGWGLTSMIIYMSILIIFLIVVAVMIYNLYNDLDNAQVRRYQTNINISEELQ